MRQNIAVGGSEVDLLYKIENGRLKPAKALQDAIGSMLKVIQHGLFQ